MSNSDSVQFASPTPWSITNNPYKIVDANGRDIARLTALDKANAELIVKAVNEYVNNHREAKKAI